MKIKKLGLLKTVSTAIPLVTITSCIFDDTEITNLSLDKEYIIYGEDNNKAVISVTTNDGSNNYKIEVTGYGEGSLWTYNSNNKTITVLEDASVKTTLTIKAIASNTITEELDIIPSSIENTVIENVTLSNDYIVYGEGNNKSTINVTTNNGSNNYVIEVTGQYADQDIWDYDSQSQTITILQNPPTTFTLNIKVWAKNSITKILEIAPSNTEKTIITDVSLSNDYIIFNEEPDESVIAVTTNDDSDDYVIQVEGHGEEKIWDFNFSTQTITLLANPTETIELEISAIASNTITKELKIYPTTEIVDIGFFGDDYIVFNESGKTNSTTIDVVTNNGIGNYEIEVTGSQQDVWDYDYSTKTITALKNPTGTVTLTIKATAKGNNLTKQINIYPTVEPDPTNISLNANVTLIIAGNLDSKIEIDITYSGIVPSSNPNVTLSNDAAKYINYSFDGFNKLVLVYKKDNLSNLILSDITFSLYVVYQGIESQHVSLILNKWDADANEYDYLNDNSKELLQFIYDRTFSIYSESSSSGGIGTGWILGKYCTWDGNDWVFDDNTNPYHYYVATNMHVRDMVEQYTDKTYLLHANSLQDNDLTANNAFINNGYLYDFDLDSDDRTLKGYIPVMKESSQVGLIVDFAILDVNFPTSMVNNAYNTEFKSSLDSVNNWITSNSTEQKFAVKLPSSIPTQYSNFDTYIQGYPSRNDEPATALGWRNAKKHTYVSDYFDYLSNNSAIISSPVYTKDGIDYYDSGVCMYTGFYEGTRGGSSGSMVINSNGETVGINFAGPTAPGDDTYGYSIYASLFSSGLSMNYDLINGYGGFYTWLKTQAV